MAKPSNKNTATQVTTKAITKTAAKTTSTKASNTAAKQSVSKKALAAKEATATVVTEKASADVKKTVTSSQGVAKDKKNSTEVTPSKAASGKTSKTQTKSVKSSSNAAAVERTVVEKTASGRGNGIACLALLCGLGGLAAGGYAYYQSTLNQQSTGGKVVSMSTQLEGLSTNQQQNIASLTEVSERVKALETQVNEQFSGVDTNFTENAVLIEKLQAQISAAEGKEPMDLLAQTQALEKRSQELQQESVDTINQLSSEVGQQVSKWRQQEMSSVLSSIDRHLTWTGDTGRAASGLKMLDQEINSLNNNAYSAVTAAIARDIAALEAVELVDLEGAYQQLTGLSEQVVSLPFMQDTLLRADKPKREIAADSSAGEGEASTTGKLKSIGKSLLADLGSMVKIQNIDKTPTASLDSKAKFMVNESMRLNFKSAQLALLNKNDSLFQAELGSALSAADQYFDQQSEDVVSWSEGLDTLTALKLNTPLPNISGSKEALAQVISQDITEASSKAAQGDQ